jgi:hypothetical protein
MAAANDQGGEHLGTWARRLPVALAFVVVLAVSTWLVTQGTWRVWDEEPYGAYADALARSLLEGRLDVPLLAVGGESFTYRGKYYCYWGVTPALLRLPAVRWWPAMAGRWSRTSYLLACLLTLLASCGVLRTLRRLAGAAAPAPSRAADSLFVLLVGLGSTLTFLAGRAFNYHEAPVWAGALALAYYWAVLSYLLRPRLLPLLAALVCSVLCVQARATVGLGPVLTSTLLGGVLLLLAWRGRHGAEAAAGAWGLARRWLGVAAVRRPFAHALVLAAGAALSVGSYMLGNYLKFGTVLDGVPLRYAGAYIARPDILARFGGRLLQLGNFRINAAAYLGRCALAGHPTFPWLKFTAPTILSGGEKHLGAEPFTGLPSCMPAFCVLALLGVAALVRGRPAGARSAVLPAAGALVGGLPVFFMYYVTHRYLHDLFPFLVLAAALGLNAALCWRRPVARRAALLTLAALTLAGVYVNCAGALFYQREQIWGTPEERRAEFRRTGRQLQELLGWCGNPEGLLLTAYRGLHPRQWRAGVTDGPPEQARLLAPGPGGWEVLADNADADRLDGPWRAGHPAGPAPAPPRCIYPFPFSMRAWPEPVALLRVPLAPGDRYLLSLSVRTENYRGRLRVDGPFLHETFPLPASAPGLQVLQLPLRPTEPETTEALVFLEGDSLGPVEQSYVWVAPPTLTRFEADDLPVRVCGTHPYSARARAGRPCYLETHRRFVDGYRARVNGRRVEVACSPAGRAMVPLDAGDNEVPLRFVGSTGLRAALLGLGAAAALLAWAGVRWARRAVGWSGGVDAGGPAACDEARGVSLGRSAT